MNTVETGKNYFFDTQERAISNLFPQFYEIEIIHFG
jgi:hypothetical protein